MFYSHEVLTSRKYGVATIWLVATLGSKSSTKKVNKKAILDVNVRKAVETIIQPEAPMALRLQSNLLYRISRVYDQQCGYVLHDAQSAQNNMRALMRLIRTSELDPKAGKARPDDLILGDDPAFFPDFAMPPINFNHSDLDALSAPSPQPSSLSLEQQGFRSTSHASLPNLQLASSSPNGDFQLPASDPFRFSSATKQIGLGQMFDENEALVFDDNLDFGFDANGEMQDCNVPIVPLRRIGSDSAASQRVRREHEDGRTRQVATDVDEGLMPHFDDDNFRLPEAEAFPAHKRSKSQSSLSQETTNESVEAPLKKRRTRKARVIKYLRADQDTQIHHSELRAFQANYITTMQEIKLLRYRKGAANRARRYAELAVFGHGIGGIGVGLGERRIASELAHEFSGDRLRLSLLGHLPERRRHGHYNTTKTPPAAEHLLNNMNGKHLGNDEFHIGRFDEEDALRQIFVDDEIEIGRHADAVPDSRRSSVMPWNINSSVHSRYTGSALAGRQSTLLTGRQSRLTSASPLVGRGRSDHIAARLDQFQRFEEIEPIQLASSDSVDAFDMELRTSSHRVTGEEFEYFGAVAGVDTQTAGTSQWMKETMARESENFLDYVRNTIAESHVNDLEHDTTNDQDVDAIEFRTLIPVNESTVVVAAQAFHHVLTLATKGSLIITQLRPWGNIELRVRHAIF